MGSQQTGSQGCELVCPLLHLWAARLLWVQHHLSVPVTERDSDYVSINHLRVVLCVDLWSQYCFLYCRDQRGNMCPRTPDKNGKVPRRAWDGAIRSWRRALHDWDAPCKQDPAAPDSSTPTSIKVRPALSKPLSSPDRYGTSFFFFFFAFPSYISGVHHFWVRFLRMWPFFNPTIKVVTFRLRGWCVLGVFLLPAFTRLGHEHQDLLSPCDEMHVCTD